MEGKERFKELLLEQLTNTFEMKGRLEAKAIGFLAFIALIMGVLIDFIGYFNEFELCPELKLIGIIFCGITFVLAMILLFMAAFTLHPKEISYFDFGLLKEFYDSEEFSTSNVEEIDASILESNNKMALDNYNMIKELEKQNSLVSKGVMILLLLFSFSSVLFFITLGVAR